MNIGGRVRVVRSKDDSNRGYVDRFFGATGAISSFHKDSETDNIRFAYVDLDSDGGTHSFYLRNLEPMEPQTKIQQYIDSQGNKHTGKMLSVTYAFELDNGQIVTSEDGGDFIGLGWSYDPQI